MSHRLISGLVFVLVVVLGVLMAPAKPLAQSAPSNGYQEELNDWRALATRAETVIERALASTEALEQLRAQVADRRQRLLAQQEAARSRTAALRGQLEALGPPPGEGESEAVEITGRRAELQQALSEANAPVLATEEALRRADRIMRDIDRIIRQRQAEQLLRAGPSPLNPVHWPGVLSETFEYQRVIEGEFRSSWRGSTREARMRQHAPAILFFVTIGLLLLFRGRNWTQKALAWLGRERFPQADLGGLVLVQAIVQVGIPMLGIWMLLQALDLAIVPGLRTGFLLDRILPAGFAIFFGRWIGRMIFDVQDGKSRYLDLPADRCATGRTTALLLGIVVGARLIVDSIGALPMVSDATWAVYAFPLVALAGLLMLRMGQLLLDHVRAVQARQDDLPIQDRLILILSRLTMAVGVIGTALVAAGYFAFYPSFMLPAIQTLALTGLILLVHRVLVDAVGFVMRLASGGTTATVGPLISALIGFALVAAAVPPALLFWGARTSDLLGLWETISAGVAFGENRISVMDFFVFLAIFFIGYSITRLVQAALRSSVLPNTRLDTGGQNAIATGVGYLGIFIAALAAITSTGLDLSNLAIVAGALSVGIGFGLQTIVSNFVSGIILLIERPIKIGDWIEVGGVSGYVRAISVRSTTIETFDRASVIVPNADLIAGSVTNWTHTNQLGRVIVPVGVAYGTDPRKVEKVLREIAEAHPMVTLNPPPSVIFQGFGADSLNFEIRAILRDVNWMLSVRSEMNYEIARRFAEEGIEIPFAQRDLWLKNADDLGKGIAQALRGGSGSDPEGVEQQAPEAPGPASADDGEKPA